MSEQEFYHVQIHHEDMPGSDMERVMSRENLLEFFKDSFALVILEREDFHYLHYVVGLTETKVRRHYG